MINHRLPHAHSYFQVVTQSKALRLKRLANQLIHCINDSLRGDAEILIEF